MIETFVSINQETSEIIINKNVISIIGYECFNSLLRRDRGSSGDSQGRQKRLFIKELAYIQLLDHPASYPNKQGYTELDADRYARKLVGMPSTWNPDELIQECRELYRFELVPLDKRIAISLTKALHNYEKIIEVASISMGIMLQSSTLNAKQLQEIKALTDVLLDLSKSVPGAISDMHKHINKVNKEAEDKKEVKLKGNSVLQDSMNPETSM